MQRRHLLAAGLTFPLLGLGAGPLHAQTVPAGPVFDPALAQSDPAQAAQAWLTSSETDGLRDLRKVGIAQFRVMFATQGVGSATASGGFGSGSGSASIHGRYVLTGVDDALMQSITDAAYDRFVQSLTARGLTVLPFVELPASARERMAGVAVPAPAEIKRASGKGQSKEYKLVSAKGLPLYFGLNDPLRQHMGFSVALSGIGWDAMEYVESGIAGADQVGLLKVTLVMDFIQMETSGGLFSNTARIGGEPGIQLTEESSLRVMLPQRLQERSKPGGGTVWAPASYSFDKMPVLALKQTLQPANSGLIGISDATNGGVAALQTALQVVGFLGGMGGGRKDKRFEVKVDPVQYQAAAQATMDAVVDTWARLIGTGG
jgi:hypothetical protein